MPSDYRASSDVDHPVFPNAKLVKENTRRVQVYKKKSVVEQSSVDLAWEMLTAEGERDLRACIYHTKEDFQRFRQLSL